MMMVQVTINEITGVIAVRNSFVSAILTMDMTGLVACARVIAAAELMLVYMVAVLMVEMPVV